MSYDVELNSKVTETLRLARINFNQSKLISINQIKEACKINQRDPFKPIYTQYLWFCLDGSKVRRKTKSGKIFTPIVIFNSVYFEPKRKFIILLRKAMAKLPNPKRQIFAKLIDRSPQAVDTWKSYRGKIPITAILKSCQLLKIDIWKFINKEKIFTAGKNKTNYIIFNNNQTINEILTWIKAEGYLHISSTEINLVQDKNGIDSLNDIINKIEKSFQIQKTKIHIGFRTDKPNAINVAISSAPLRQILCLRYNVPIGFKSYEINYEKEIENTKNKEEKFQILSKIFESEGSFGFDKWNLPDFHMVSANYEATKNIATLLKELEYNPYGPTPHHSAFKTGITNIEGSVKFCYDILPYFKHKEKIQYILFGNNKTTYGLLSEDYLQRFKKKIKPAKHWLLISWIHSITSRKTLEKSRGFSFKHIEEVKNGRNF